MNSKDIAVYKEKVTNWFIDTHIEEGKTYEYRVAAVNKTGTSRFSECVRATAISEGEWPQEWAYGEIGDVVGGKVAYADVQEGTFRLECREGFMGNGVEKILRLYIGKSKVIFLFLAVSTR